MNNPNHQRDAFLPLLPAWVEALAVAQKDGTYPSSVQGPLAGLIDRLTDHGLDKRFVKLVFDTDSGRLGGSDNEPLPHTGSLPPDQRDILTCRQARKTMEVEIRRNIEEHTRFQELWNVTPRRQAELDTNADLRVHLNPIRLLVPLTAPGLLKGVADLPSEGLFFAAGNTIRAAVLGAKGRALLNAFARFGPSTVRQFWLLNSHSDRAEIVCFCRDLAQVGLVAFGA